MAGYLGKTTNDPRDITDRQAQAQQEAQWGPIPGRIVSYDHDSQTATVQPLYRPLHNGQPVDMPQLLEVPVDLPRTADAAITFPIKPGTRVELAPMMRSMDNYDVDDDGAPYDARSFSLSDMRAKIAGGDSASSPLDNVDPDNTHLRFSADGLFGLKGSPDGKFQIAGAEGEWLDLLATHVEQSARGFHLLATEPALIHTGDYEDIGDQLDVISGKLRAMIL